MNADATSRTSSCRNSTSALDPLQTFGPRVLLRPAPNCRRRGASWSSVYFGICRLSTFSC